ncbi:serine/threonine protein kinase, partial [Acidobacteria bacterium ACD]|nr:serine/threonine protein kinase [Acidobacteria bacterium ACD]
MAHTVVGDRIARRYRLVRFVAQGGMGEVWEALDETLGQRVALKMIRRDLLSRPVVMERLKRETSLARRVTHPNVCRLYDIGEHEDARTGERVTFLTMELLDGPTLEETIRTRGRLSPAEALPLAVQMAEGLAAAHEAGVVHRDLKSANVLLVPTSDGSRAVITDFGLARSSLEDGTSLGLTSADATVGTPAYMSPEQAEGLPAGPRADVYSLGVVLYEMVTGRWPHSGPTPMSTLLKRLREPPPSPRDVVPDLDPRWEAVILRCLAVSPQDRFASAREVALSLTSPDGPTPLSTPSPGPVPSPAVTPTVRLARPSRRRLLFVAAGVLVLAAVSSGLLWRSRQRGVNVEAGAPQSRKAVAVLGFKNLSQRPEAAWLSTAISEMLTAELSAGGALRTIPGESVARMRRDLALPETESFARDTLEKIRGHVGADVVVSGSYLAVPGPAGEQLRLLVTLQDAGVPETERTVSETGTVGEILVLVSRAGARLREALGATEPSGEQATRARAGFPRDPEALRRYAEGLRHLRELDPRAGRDELLVAVELDPGNPLAHAALAQAWADLGYDARAEAEARKAFELSGGLSREERLFVEARLAERSRDWERAIESYRTLFGFFPDSLEYGLRLADAQVATRRSAEALKTVAALRR